MEKKMPECPFCSAGSQFVVPNYAIFLCNHCNGYFDENGEAVPYFPRDEAGYDPNNPEDMTEEDYRDFMASHGAL